MPQETVNRYINRAFSLAMMLTGETRSAESVVVAAIDAVPCDIFSETNLLEEVAKVAWNRSQLGAKSEWQERCDEAPPISDELQRVAALPERNRYCFAMRVLAGMTAQTCGRLIGLRPDQVNYFADLSIRLLSKAARLHDERMSLTAR